MINEHSTTTRTSRRHQPTHYLALWTPTGELIACVPIGEHVQLRHRAVTRLLDSADAYDAGALVVYPVALTDNSNDVPLGFDRVYTGMGLPGGNAVAWAPT
jgi:hypothetical protein